MTEQDQAAAAALQAATQMHTRGRLDEAAIAYDALLQAGHPQTADILHLFGLLRGQQQQHAAARVLLKCAFAHGRPVKLVFSYAKRSEEHTSELQSLMRISYAVFCLKKTTTLDQIER